MEKDYMRVVKQNFELQAECRRLNALLEEEIMRDYRCVAKFQMKSGRIFALVEDVKAYTSTDAVKMFIEALKGDSRITSDVKRYSVTVKHD